MAVTDLTAIARNNYKDSNQVLQFGIRNWGYGIADEQIPGVDYIDKFGCNPTAAAADVIQDEEGAITINTTASAIELLCADVDDTAGGAGAEAVEIFGVDISWNPISDIIASNGQSASLPSSNEYLYVYRARICNSGAVRNEGLITIRRESAGATEAMILAGRGQTQKAVFPVFAGCKLYMNKFRMEGTKTGTLTGELGLMDYQEGEGIRVRHPIVFSQGSPAKAVWEDTPKVFQEKTLVWVEVLSISAGAIISASFDGIIMRHTDSTV